MSTFIGQLVGFAVIVFIVWKFVVPPVRNLMKARQETVRSQLEESADTAKKLGEAESSHAEALKEAKADAAKVVEEARFDAEKIAEQLRAQADHEVERVKVQGAQQVQLLRQQLIRELRANLGTESVERAGELVREHIADADNQSATVDRFLDELDAMAPSTAVIEDAAGSRLRSTSRESLRTVVERFDEVTADLNANGLGQLADDLASVAGLLIEEAVVTKHLAEPADNAEPKLGLLEALLSDKVSDDALDVLKTAVSQRWSAESDLIEVVQHVARLALLVRAENDDEMEEVEDQLFRFGRIVGSQQELNALLSDFTAPAESRIQLLDSVIDGKVNATAAALLAQTVELLRSGHADEAILELAELAVARRGEVVAHVSAAAQLKSAQRKRLIEVLSRIYSQPVSIQLNLDPQLLGGLTIAVGEEVIDGSLASRLSSAGSRLPD